MINSTKQETKKNEEKKYLEFFLTTPEGKQWLKDNKIESPENFCGSERPDFIFTNSLGEPIGIEVVSFYHESLQRDAMCPLITLGEKVLIETENKLNQTQRPYLHPKLIIDIFDHRLWQFSTLEELIDRRINPGLYQRVSGSLFKRKLEEFVNQNLYILFRNTILERRESFEVDGIYFTALLRNFSLFSSDEPCIVNNVGNITTNPINELQSLISSKNNKITSYLKQCKNCSLLIVVPKISTGNYCEFNDNITNKTIDSSFQDTFLFIDQRPYKKTEFNCYKL